MLRPLTVCLVFLAIALTMLSWTATADRARFAEFRRTHNKNYSSDAEHQSRYEIFVNNLAVLANLTQGLSEEENIYGVTQFFDLTMDEFVQGYLISEETLRTTIQEMRRDATPYEPSPREKRDIPTSFDWRNHNPPVITDVINQGACSSCWAISAVEEIESMWALAGNPLTQLSISQVVDCDTGGYDHGCSGGGPPGAYRYIQSAGGLESAAVYPYHASNGNCGKHAYQSEKSVTSCNPGFSAGSIVARFSSWSFVTSTYDENAMASFVANTGPLSVCVDALTWYYYRGGKKSYGEFRCHN